MKDISALCRELESLETQRLAVQDQLDAARKVRAEDPTGYIAHLIYENRKKNGSFGYEYGIFGASERARADEVLAVAHGDVDMAAEIVLKLHIA